MPEQGEDRRRIRITRLPSQAQGIKIPGGIHLPIDRRKRPPPPDSGPVAVANSSPIFTADSGTGANSRLTTPSTPCSLTTTRRRPTPSLQRPQRVRSLALPHRRAQLHQNRPEIVGPQPPGQAAPATKGARQSAPLRWQYVANPVRTAISPKKSPDPYQPHNLPA